MSTTPTRRAENVWQVKSGDDFLQCLGPTGNMICWLDSNGVYQSVPTSVPFSKIYIVDSSRTDQYQTPNGSICSPFRAIMDAVNQIIANGDGLTNSYTILIYPGVYPETIDLSNPTLNGISFIGLGLPVVGGVSFTGTLLQIINNDNLKDVLFRSMTFLSSPGAPHSFQLSSTTNGTNFGNPNGIGILFLDCVFEFGSDFVINNCANVTWDRCFINGFGGGGGIINVTNCILALVKGGQGLTQGSQFNVFTVAGPQPNGFSASQIQVQNATCLATVSIDAGSSFIAAMGSRIRSAVTVNGAFTSRASHTSGAITVNSGGTYKEDGGAGHTGSITLNGTGAYVQTGTYGIGTLMLNGVQVSSISGTPNGVITGSPGDLLTSKSGGAGTTLWVKESGVNTNTGWIGK